MVCSSVSRSAPADAFSQRAVKHRVQQVISQLKARFSTSAQCYRALDADGDGMVSVSDLRKVLARANR